MALTIFPIPTFKDNYVWCLALDKQACVVDPGDAGPVLDYLQENGLQLGGILVTHHHWDHVNGIKKLVRAYPASRVWAPAAESIPDCSDPVAAGDRIATPLGLEFEVIDLAGHTAGHIGFFAADAQPDPLIFCGDTLFSAGCGRLFEGTPQQMYNSINRIKNLSKNLIIYCTHEYTRANLEFAQAVNPNNSAISNYQQEVDAMRADNMPTLPTTLELELKINPFLRVSDPDIVNQITKKYGKPPLSDEESFAMLRAWKDNF